MFCNNCLIYRRIAMNHLQRSVFIAALSLEEKKCPYEGDHFTEKYTKVPLNVGDAMQPLISTVAR